MLKWGYSLRRSEICFGGKFIEFRKLVVALFVVLVVIIALGISLGLGLRGDNDDKTFVTKRYPGQFEKAAVATDAGQCSKIGRDLLKENGHAVDAAIAALICAGVVNIHSTGISGGGFMTIYDRSRKESRMFDYREVGPAALTATIFDADPKKAIYGGMAVGVPGELRGLKMAHDQYGKLEWSRLIQPSIDLAESGININQHMFDNMEHSKEKIKKDPGLKELLMKDGELLELRALIKNPKYADSLRKIRDNPDDLNTGELSRVLLDDVKANGGVMTANDLKNYQVKVRTPIRIKLNDELTLHTSALPGGGSVLVHILNMVEGFKLSKDDESSMQKKILMYHRIVECFKFSYAMRPYLGDPDNIPAAGKADFEEYKDAILSKVNASKHRAMIDDDSTKPIGYYDPFFVTTEDQGTTHVSVLDEEGNAVSATDTINWAFGAKLRSTTSGIVYNNELADYFTKTSYKQSDGKTTTYFPKPKVNVPGPGRRPLSSTCPSIITDANGNVVMVVGGSGGTRITLATAWVIIKKLWLDYTLAEAIEDARPQHSLFPNLIRNEKGMPLSQEIIDGLKAKHHEFEDVPSNAIIQGIFVEDGTIFAKADPRKEGDSAGY